ncbi:sugar phosphate isomerase/epimerase [Candidatus Thorarchaeota archaeon]|nr:MAG: sugar phosphate isomerase/epimerase [Candidatus Thorarchaeota archaeon]
MFVSCSTLGGVRSDSDSELFLVDQITTLYRVKHSGYDCVELYYQPHPDWVKDTILSALEDLELAAYSIHLPKFLFEYEEDDFHASVYQCLGLADEAEVEVAVLHPPNEDDLKGERWREYLDKLIEACDESDCSLTLEIVPYLTNVHEFIRDQIEFYEESDLGVTIDLEFMHVQGLRIESLMDLFGDRVSNIHFRDSDGSLLDQEGRRKYLVPGSGEIDLKHVIQVLKTNDYEGAITVEVSHKKRKDIVTAKQYLDYLLSIA